MTFWVYSVMHNEAPMLPFFLRHYLPLADRVVIFDDHSDDGTAELARAAGADVRPYPGAGLDDGELVDFASATYPEARGLTDWCAWVDADEFLFHPDLLARLARYRADGVDLPPIAGYAMFANAFPTTSGQIYDEVHVGVPYDGYSKPVVFDPELSLRWIPGKHTLTFDDGAERGPGPAEIKLLHFRHLGEAYFSGRNARNYARMTARNIRLNHGYQTYPENQAAEGWAAQVKKIEPDLRVVV